MRSVVCGSFAIVLALSGCPKETTAPPSGAAPSPSAAAAPSAAIARLRGQWLVKLSPKQERDLETMRLVFGDSDPSPERLATLSADERSTILAVREARKQAPDDPQYLEMQAVLQGMGRSTMMVHTSSLTLSVGAVRQTAAFRVLTETATAVTLDATTPAGKHERVVLGIVGPDELTMSKPSQREQLVFRRAQ